MNNVVGGFDLTKVGTSDDYCELSPTERHDWKSYMGSKDLVQCSHCHLVIMK